MDEEQIFHEIKSAQLSEKQRSIKLLLEQAKVESAAGVGGVEDADDYDDEPEPLTTPGPNEEEEEYEDETTTTTTTTEPAKAAVPFKTPEERPDFLEVVKKKAKQFKEILEVIKENGTVIEDDADADEYDDDEEVEVVTITVVTSTSSTLSKGKPTKKATTLAKPTTTTTTSTSTTEETTLTEEFVEPTSSLPTTTLETTTEDDVVEEEDAEEQDSEDGEERFDTVFVVEAMPAVPKAEPLVDEKKKLVIRVEEKEEDTDEQKTSGEDEASGNALQESRIHETVHEHGGRHATLMGKPSSVDMLMSLIDHLDLGAIMDHLGGGDGDDNGGHDAGPDGMHHRRHPHHPADSEIVTTGKNA